MGTSEGGRAYGSIIPPWPPSTSLVIPPAGLEGTLEVPAGAEAVVVFAHGSGSSRHSPRNQQVAETLRRAGLATLLCDLLSEDEAADPRNVFRYRPAGATPGGGSALRDQPWHDGGPAGRLVRRQYRAAAALVAAAERPATVGAVVSRGGRPDLAGELRLRNVAAPTLLIVGGADRRVLELNEWARAAMTCPTEFAIVQGATHLFEEAGALEQVADLAAAWFRRWLVTEADHAEV